MSRARAADLGQAATLAVQAELHERAATGIGVGLYPAMSSATRSTFSASTTSSI